MAPLLEFAQWIQSTAVPRRCACPPTSIPSILTLHLIGIAFFGGMIFITNLRLLGVDPAQDPGFKGDPVLARPKRIGFAIVVTCGLLMASSKAEEYYYNWFFWTKMSLLALIAVHGLVFGRSVYRKPAKRPRTGQAGGARCRWFCGPA